MAKIEEILHESERRSLLKLSTAGSVDDGKSTLIGRLLHDTKGLYEDQLAGLKGKARQSGGGEIDFASVTDGLKAEQEQGITIDVAYRYFSTPKRHFILADTPGHEQYTRNMATGASTAALAIILVDARNGITTQTKRHSFISALLGIPRLVVAVNKMDLVDWSQDVFEGIKDEFTQFASKLNVQDIQFIPISALTGDNVAWRSEAMSWYDGPSIIKQLEEAYVESDRNLVDFRFPVQYVVRPNQDFRGYAGQIVSGSVKPGDEVLILPSRRTSKVRSIETFDGSLERAFAPMAPTVRLEDEIDISRGDMIVRKDNVPRVEQTFEAILIWMAEEPMRTGRPYKLKHTSRFCQAQVDKLRYQIDVNELSRAEGSGLELNEIGRAQVTASQPLFIDSYHQCKSTGSFILIDPITNATLAAGIIVDRHTADELGRSKTATEKTESAPVSKNITEQADGVLLGEREERAGHKGVTLWLTGLSGSGKSSIAAALERRLFDSGTNARILDGDNFRFGLSRDLGFSAEDRSENIRRVAEVSRLFNRTGVMTICSFISPFRADRENARHVVGDERFFEVFVDTPLEVCEERDPKGLYKKARAGEIREFTGVSSPYEAPESPDLKLDASKTSVEECVDRILDKIRDAGVFLR